MNNLNNIITAKNTTFKTCSHCGLTSPEVITRTCYIGGKGNVPVNECADVVACWSRYDAKNTKASIYGLQSQNIDWAMSRIKGG